MVGAERSKLVAGMVSTEFDITTVGAPMMVVVIGMSKLDCWVVQF